MSKMSEYDRTHVGEVLVTGTWFTADLFRLINKADNANRERIRIAFPDEVAAYEAWHDNPYAPILAAKNEDR